MVNLNRLYYFYIFSKRKNVVQAAKLLSISQPALSSQLKLLENELGGGLFYKNGRALELTEKGTQTYDYCRRIFEICEQMNSLQEKQTDVRTKFSVGVSDQIDRSFMAHFTGRVITSNLISRQHSVQLRSDSHDNLVNSLKDNRFDLLITNQPVMDREIRVLGRLEMPVVFAVAYSYLRLKSSKRDSSHLNFSRLLKNFSDDLIMPSKKLHLRTETDQFLEGTLGSIQPIFEADILAPVVTAIVSGVGPGFIPIHYIYSYLRDKKIKIFRPKKGLWNHTIWLLSRHRSQQSPILTAFSEEFKAMDYYSVPLESPGSDS